MTGVGVSNEGEFGANEWLVEELYEQFKVDKNSVDKSWWPILEAYTPADLGDGAAKGESLQTPSAAPAPSATAAEPHPVTAPIPVIGAQPVARTTAKPAARQPIPAQAPKSQPSDPAVAAEEDTVTVLRGMTKTLAANMDESLTVPTATSVRTVPAKLMIDNRIVINNHMSRTRGGKISFTHLIGWALIQALKEFPSQNVFYAEVDGKPSVVAPAHINLGIAIDLPKPDGTRALMVPSIKRAETLSFHDFLSSYEDLVKRARNNKLTGADFQGTTLSLTNPGGIGTVHSVPRLMKGQGCIVGAGALEYPAEFQGSSDKTLTELGIGKTITLTSTYDHRVIQGAGSGEFLKKVHELLIGQRGFYEDIFAALRIPYAPIHWASDI
ncbi:MAG: kgd, partial [Microbacterium sp.]|nr:kgd [Microbacterium sp.]